MVFAALGKLGRVNGCRIEVDSGFHWHGRILLEYLGILDIGRQSFANSEAMLLFGEEFQLQRRFV